MKKLLAIAITGLTVSACATPPENVAAVNVGDVYSGTSCAQTRANIAKLENNVASLSAQQRKARNNDSWGVFLIGLPISSMAGGDVEAELAIEKGRLAAANERLARC